MVNLNAGILSEILFLLQIDQMQLKEKIEDSLCNFRSRSIQCRLGRKFPVYDEHFHLVLKVAASISEKLGHEYVGIEHMLLALLKYEESNIPEYFESFNATENDIIAEVREYLHLSKEHKPNTKSREKYFSTASSGKRDETAKLRKICH